MNTSSLRLYVDSEFTSPYAMSVFVALREKRLDFEMSLVNLGHAGNRAPEYANLSVTQRVPMLVHGRLAVSESSAITEYLDECFAQHPLYPQDPVQRARARQVQAWLRSDLLALREERSTLGIFYGVHSGPLSCTAQAAAQKLIEGAQVLLVNGAEYLFGRWSIADIDLALMLNRLILNGDPVPADLVAYADRQWQHAAVREWMALERPALG